MKEKLIAQLSYKQAVAICEYYHLGNIKLIRQLTKKVIVSEYIKPANLSYKQLVKAI